MRTKTILILSQLLWLLVLPSRGAEEIRDLKDQKRSLIRWSEIDSEDWLSYRLWKNDRARRDKEPDWETRVRERSAKEVVGRVIACVGVCRAYRGESFFSTEYRSALREGDELMTQQNSYVWVYLIDGTLIRMSPDSSITFKEFNTGKSENFLHARINSGNILWLSRMEQKLKESNLRETDSLFIPLSFYEANPTSDKVKKMDEDNLFALLEEPKVNIRQMKRLNKLILENNKTTKKKKTFSFLIMPNGTVSGYDLNMEFVVQIGDVSYFKKRTHEQLGLISADDESETTFYFRGLENRNEETIAPGQWYEIGVKGRSIKKFFNTQKFSVGEYITKRFATILVARELMLKRYSNFLFEKDPNPNVLAKRGYRLWGNIQEGEKKEDLNLRIAFLKEYTRRTETTNLLSAERFRKKLAVRGESLDGLKYGSHYYKRALENLIISREQDRQGEADSDREVLNSTQKRFWKILHDIR